MWATDCAVKGHTHHLTRFMSRAEAVVLKEPDSDPLADTWRASWRSRKQQRHPLGT